MVIKLKKIKSNIMLFIIFLLFIFIIGFKTYEGFNTDFPQSRYKPYKTTAIPTAMDGTPYLSPDENGNCPNGFQRNKSNPNSLCHGVCKTGDFYYDDSKVFSNAYGCVKLNTSYPQKNYSSATYPFAKDGKTNIVSPTIDAKCPNYFDLDLISGLCYTKCDVDHKFYGNIGCVKLNTTYPQSNYDDKNPYPIAADQQTKYVSPTSNAICPNGFMLDYKSGLCHSPCPSNKKFNGERSELTIVGCN
jgi:hypothetical protein